MKTWVLLVLGLVSFCTAQSRVSPGENEFNLVFDFEGVATNCCPGALPTCGDGYCNRTETCVTCPADCPCALCGDGICDTRQGEDCKKCPKDCGKCPVVPCGDGICDSPLNENCVGCSKDCGECVVCGDGRCEFTEDCDTCTQDCGKCDIGYLQGIVRDLITFKPVANATISTIGHKGSIVWTKTNDEGVYYFLRLPPGVLSLSTTHPNYGGPQLDETTIFTNVISNQEILLGPKIGPEEWWFVMRWKEVSDLDLTMFGGFEQPYSTGIVNFEFMDKNQSLPYGVLNSDIRWTPQETLPEILKMNFVTKQPKNVEVYVHNWSGDRRNSSMKMENSAVRVSVVTGSRGVVSFLTVDPAFDPDTNAASKDALWWHVYDVTPQNDVVAVNTFQKSNSVLCGYSYCLPNGFKPFDIGKTKK